LQLYITVERFIDMYSDALNSLLAVLKVEANVFHNGQYCGVWAVDTSGSNLMSFHVVTRGQCVIDVSNETHYLNEGDAVFMPSDAKHSIHSVSEGEVELNKAPSLAMTKQLDVPSTGLVCGYFTHQHPVFSRLLEQLPNVIVIRQESDSSSSIIIDLILNESRSSGQSTNFILNRLSDALFYLMVRDNLDSLSGVFAASTHPNLSKALELIHSSTDTLLPVEKLANAAGMSRSAFSSLFKQIVEQSPAEYIIQWRMTQAYRWLVDDRVTTYDAALRCGYESESSFSKAFKRIIGIGPGEARQANK